MTGSPTRPAEAPAEPAAAPALEAGVAGRALGRAPLAAEAPPKRVSRRAWEFFAKTYATADARSLGLFRVALGALLCVDVARRIPDLALHYANSGWLTNHFALFRPMSNHLFSVYLAFSSLEEVRVLVTLHLVVNLLLLVGYQTRWMHALAALLITSLNSRAILIENPGWLVLNLLTVWSLFLPLGQRFSVDAFLTSWRRRREGSLAALNDRDPPSRARAPVVSLAVTALAAQLAVIYVFDTLQKTGPPWKEGTAVYYLLQQTRGVTDFGAAIAGDLPLALSRWLTWSVLAVQAAIALLLVSPAASGWCRAMAFALAAVLHGSMAAVLQLWPYSAAMLIAFVALIPPEPWQKLRDGLARRAARRIVHVDPRSQVSLTLARIVKRLDALGKVRFLEREGLATFVVAEEGGERVFEGIDGVIALCDALVVPGAALLWLKLPGARQLGDWALRRLHVRSSPLALAGIDEVADDPSPARLLLRKLGFYAGQLAVLGLAVVAATQVLIDNPIIPPSFKPLGRPAWMEAVAVYPRLLQNWSLFAPAPPADETWLVVDGRTADGRALDPLTGREPCLEAHSKCVPRKTRTWADFDRRIVEPRFKVYVEGVRHLLLNHHLVTGRPKDRLVAFDLWVVRTEIPPPGVERRSTERRKILSHGTVR